MWNNIILKNINVKIDELLKSEKVAIIAIDGKAAAGKTTLADHLSSIFPCNVFHGDDFFLREEMKTPSRLKEIGGNMDRERFFEEIIRGIIAEKPFYFRKYDCKSQALGPGVSVKPMKLNIVEGAYCLHPELSPYYDFKIFLSVNKEVQSRRILERNGPIMHKRFIDEWIPKENSYFEEFDIMNQCDIMLDTSVDK